MEPAARLVANLLFLALHALEANGGYNVSVLISFYSNPSHRHYSGDCCDFIAVWGSCWGDCDNYFLVCLGEGSEEVCRDTGEVGDSDSITFDSHVGRLPNPINFTVDGSWNGGLSVTVDVYDNDHYSDDEFIGWFRVTEPTNGSLALSGRQASITLSVTVSCSEGYFGADCSVECEPEPSSHWCGSDGRWVCVDGWTGEWCDICTPPSNCSKTGGYCRSPGQCLCREGFTGPSCNTSSSPTLPPSTSGALPNTTNTSPHSPTSVATNIGIPSNTPLPTAPATEPPTSGPKPTSDFSPTTNSSPDQPPTGPSNISFSTGIVTPASTAVLESLVDQVIPTGTSKPQPFSHSNGRGEMGSVIGGVTAGLVVLIVLLVFLIIAIWYCLYQQRQKRKRKKRGDDVHPLVQPLIGENPMYVDHAMGTHAAHQNGREYHQFTNPLYGLVRSTQSLSSPTRSAAPSSPLYAYPTRRGHLLASVYLPGDDSPLTGSLSSQQHGVSSSPRGDQHFEQQPLLPSTVSGEEQPANSDVGEPANSDYRSTSSGDEGHRTISISNQYFHLPPDSDA